MLKHALQTTNDYPWRKAAIIGLTVVILFTAFMLSPWDGFDDWYTFHGAARRAVDPGTALYGTPTFRDYYYYNPPWLALLLVLTAPFPAQVGWAVISLGTLTIALLLLHRWDPVPGLIKPILVMLSPPMLYILLHGQIDVLIIGAVLLPAEWWALAALTKPQAALGLAVLIPPRLWLRAAVITGAVVTLSLLLYGFWPTRMLDQPRPFVDQGHNLWLNLWPNQIPAGIMLVALGYTRRDERLVIAGSPLLSPYAPMSSMIGPWIAALTFLNDWQATLVYASWWGAIILRGLGG